MNQWNFMRLLKELDPTEMAPHSVCNHHVQGVDYLCLHRSDKLTVKLYFIDPARCPYGPGAHLVTPHTHRYAFESTVLAGTLNHVTFMECRGANYDRFKYVPEQREREHIGESDLELRSVDTYGAGGEYWCGIRDIHTLVVPYRPVLLGLVQFADSVGSSRVYLRKEMEMVYPASHSPTVDETRELRDRAISMMEVAWPPPSNSAAGTAGGSMCSASGRMEN